MKLRNLLFVLVALLFAACRDDEPEPQPRVDIITESGVTSVNGKTFKMPQNAESMVVTLISTGLDDGSISVLEADRGMSVELLDPYDLNNLTRYDEIRLPSSSDFAIHTYRFKQRIKITATSYSDSDFKERRIKLDIVPIDGYDIHSVVAFVSPKPIVNKK